MLTDAELLRRYVDDKSEPAFTELVDRHLDLVYSAALRQLDGDAHRARDVAQLVFTTLARKASSLVPHPVLTGWLYTTTRFTAEKLRRADWRRQVREKEAHAMQETLRSDSSDTAVNWEQVRPQLDAAMGELNERDREAVLLRFFARRPFAEIGAALQLSEDAARMRVERALEKLRAILGRRGISSTSAALALSLTGHAVAAAPAGLAASITGGALAGSAPGGIIAFMSTTKVPTALAAVAVLALCGSALYQTRASRRAVAELAAVKSELGTQLDAMNSLQRRATAAESDVTSLQRAVDQATAAQTVGALRTADSAKRPPADAAQADQLAVGNAFLAAHPAVRQALLDRSYARVASRFAPMYARLALTPGQIARFEALMVEGEGISLGNDKDGMILRPGTGMSREETEAAVHALLGDAGFEVFSETMLQANGRSLMTDLAASLYYTNMPLTPAQSDQLVQILTELRQLQSKTANAQAGREAFMAQAATVLQPPQLVALQGLQIQKEYQGALEVAMRRWSLPGWGSTKKP